MKKDFFFFLTLIFLSGKLFAAAANTPVGYWQTVDDKTGKILSIVQIYPTKNRTLEGKIVKIMPVLGQRPTDLCTRCPGDLRGRPMLGLVILWGMQQQGEALWGSGRVLDPKSGNIYKGTLRVINRGDNLKLRGYIGIPALGRSETWHRTDKP